MSKPVLVFGSNEAGFHGGGAALYAYQERGARWGMSYGHVRDSFAIPTKGFKWIPSKLPDGTLTSVRTIGDTLPLHVIKDYVTGFLAYARGLPDIVFHVTRIGCGLAGHKDSDIAPMFLEAPPNCLFDTAWKPILMGAMPAKEYWGTF